MRRIIVFATILFFILSWMVYVAFYRGDASDLMMRYQQIAPFSGQELTYRAVSRPFLGEGVVLYQPTFPNLPLRLRSERMSLRLLPTENIIRLSNVNIDVVGSLMNRQNDDWTNTIRTHRPPVDFIINVLYNVFIVRENI